MNKKYPTYWTHSRLSDYEKCPLMYAGKYLQYFGPLQYKQSPAAARGDKIHGLMEQAVAGSKLAGALDRYNDYVAELRQWPVVHTERKLALDAGWNPLDWSASGMWWRGKMDVECHNAKKKRGKAVDWKTGNIYGTNADQIRLYAGVMFEHERTYKEVEVELVYLDQRKSIVETITRKEWLDYKPEFTRRAAAMLADRKHRATPGDACRWCDFSAAKGGPCKSGVVDRRAVQTESRTARVVVSEAVPLRRGRPRPGTAAP